MKKMIAWFLSLERFVDRVWYVPVVAILAAVDLFVVVIPTDGILVSTALVRPKRWLSIAVTVSLGSALGAVVMAYGFHVFGHGFTEWLGLGGGDLGQTWIKTQSLIQNHGFWGLVVMAGGPVLLAPAVILAGTAHVSMAEVFWGVLFGRVVKWGVFCWLASHAPKTLAKLKFLRSELKEMKDIKKNQDVDLGK